MAGAFQLMNLPQVTVCMGTNFCIRFIKKRSQTLRAVSQFHCYGIKKLNKLYPIKSSEIIRMFNSAFDSITGNDLDLWPVAKREAIEGVNDDVY